MKEFTSTSHCISRRHCETCRATADWRKAVGAPDECPYVRGLGDAVALVAQPIARVIDRAFGTNVQGCGGCKARQDALNQALPFKPPAP